MATISGPLGRRILVMAATAVTGCGGLSRGDNARGVSLYGQGNYRAAAEEFQRTLARRPGDPDSSYNLGATYHQQAKLFARPADLATAEAYYRLCLAGNPGHEACRRGLAVLLVEERRSGEAEAMLADWARSQPGNPAPHIERARLAHERGDLREAENELIDAVRLAPNDPRALVALGSLREAGGRPAEALDAYARALAIDPGQPTVSARATALASAATQGYRTAALPPPPAFATPAGIAAPAGITAGAPGTPAR